MIKHVFTLVTILVLSSSGYGYSQESSINDHPDKSEKIVSLAQTHIFNAELLKSPEWDEFTAYLNSGKLDGLEGQEYVEAFNEKSEELPFSHFYLYYSKTEQKKEIKSEIPFELEEIDSKTVVLHLRKFVADAGAMVKIVKEIDAKNYKNLIIDLRNNGGGTLDAGVVLGRFLTKDPIDTGTYVTRKWYDEKSVAPTKEDIQHFAFLQDMTHEGFVKIQKEPAFRMVLPGHDGATFKGKVFVLTNRFSASACEPFVHVLKTQTNATIIGEITAGQMLSAVWFDVDEKMSLFIPINDYITAEGTRLDQVGVTPHIETSSANALEVALKQIN